MSELKAYLCEKASEIESKDFLCYRFKFATKPSLKATMEEVYLKSDADKVIAELKAQKAQTEDDCAYWKTMAQKNAEDNVVIAKQRAKALEREQHHKYKRCLDKAEMCKARYDAEDAKVNGNGASWEYISKEMKYWERWRWRWDALAEQFKPEGK